jgi:hypothetical protein
MRSLADRLAPSLVSSRLAVGLLVGLLAACEPTSTGGDLFGPAAGSSAPVVGSASPDAASGGASGVSGKRADPAFADFEEPAFKMSSDELHQSANAAPSDAAPSAAPAAAAAPAAPAVVAAPPGPAEAAPVAAPPSPPAGSIAPLSALAAPGPWPVRLLRTLPETQPPRAILGLPDGREIVVSPGSMVPEQGLVVMAVGKGHLSLARVTGQGDHVALSELTLQSQY